MFQVVATGDNETIELDSDNENCTSTLNIETLKGSFNPTKKDDVQKEQSGILGDEKLKPARSLKRKRDAIDETKLSNTEETLRVERIKRVMEQDQQLAHTKQEHERNMNNMKENHLKEIHNLELQHLKQIQILEIEIKKAQLRAIEFKKNKENIDTFRV